MSGLIAGASWPAGHDEVRGANVPINGADGDRSLDRFQMLNENLQSGLGDFWKRRIAFGLLRLWDRGHWEPEGNKTPEEALAGDFKFKLQGQRLQGSWILIAMKQAMYGWLANRCSLRRALSH